MITEQLVNCFLAVVKNGSFTKAAEEMFLTQQAVSKHVKKLEQELETELLVRTTRMIHPTETGELYYQMFLKWKTEIEALKEQTSTSSEQHKSLRIGILLFMINGKVPMIVHEMKRQHPEYQISIIHDDGIGLYRRLMDNEVDLVITYDLFMPQEKEFKSTIFGQTERQLMLAKSHPLATDTFQLRDVENINMLLFINKGESKAQSMKKALEERKSLGLGNGPVRLFHTMEEVNLMTELGEGFSLNSATSMFSSNPMIRYYSLGKKTTIIGVWKGKNNNKLLKEFFLTANSIFGGTDSIISAE
jgi:DNA-binding transcriptional LysR family regulator